MKNTPLDNDEAPELTEEDFKKMRPASELHPGLVEASKRARGRPKKNACKEPITIRLDPKIVQHFKDQGDGWQTKINDVLKEYVEEHES